MRVARKGKANSSIRVQSAQSKDLKGALNILGGMLNIEANNK